MVFSFDRKRWRAMRRWKNWALSVARAGLPTVPDLRGFLRASCPLVGASLLAKIVNDNADIRVYAALSGFSRASSLLQG
ncbi:hypothetical protein PverR02_02075 [Pseudomonas veronii]|nr:hypothetical protein PverR02_02075 [Pseudomonas veronii]